MNYSNAAVDQADSLRHLEGNRAGHLRLVPPLFSRNSGVGARVVTVTSGKGGVGKSNVVVNLAVALAKAGKKVLVIDADLGLGNIDVLLGINSHNNLNDVLSGRLHLSDIIVEGPCGIKVVPAGSGVQRYTSMTKEDRLILMDELEALDDDYDILLIDTESGISSNVTFFSVASQEILLVVTPEPTSVTDSYALIKLLSIAHGEVNFKILVNMAQNETEGAQVYKQLSQVVERFLDVSLDYVGCIVRDARLQDAVKWQSAVVEIYPRTPASLCFAKLARDFIECTVERRIKGNIQFLLRKQFESAKAVRCV